MLLTNFGSPALHHSQTTVTLTNVTPVTHPLCTHSVNQRLGMQGLMFLLTMSSMARCVSGSCHSHACNGAALITHCTQSYQDLQLLFRCIFNLTINQGVLLTNDCNYRKGHYWHVCMCGVCECVGGCFTDNMFVHLRIVCTTCELWVLVFVFNSWYCS